MIELTEHDWDTTSKAGFDFEDTTLKDITQKKYPLAYKNMTKTEYSYYDLVLFNGKFPIVMEEQLKVECKFDEFGLISKNICIEVGCNGRLSGLALTTAQFWIISDGVTTFIAKTDEIRRCIAENDQEIEYKRKERVIQKKGEYKEMDMYIIPRRIFEPYCCEIGKMTEMKYDCLV